MLPQLMEAWNTNNRINLFLIDHVSEEGWACTLSKRGGRDVGRQFAHLHNVRVWHLERRAKDLAAGLAVFQGKITPDRTAVTEALRTSANAVGLFLGGVLSGAPRRRGFKKGIFTTLGYLIAHESHHRGNILLTLKECGHKLDQKTQDSIWGWDQI